MRITRTRTPGVYNVTKKTEIVRVRLEVPTAVSGSLGGMTHYGLVVHVNCGWISGRNFISVSKCPDRFCGPTSILSNTLRRPFLLQQSLSEHEAEHSIQSSKS